MGKRRERINARGEVWCFNCKRYLPGERFTYAHPPSWERARFWSHCQECTRQLDRLRRRNMRGTPEWAADIKRRVRQKRRQRAGEVAARKQFVQGAIGILRRRGLTKSEISRLTQTSLGSLLAWERAEVRPDPNVAARLGALILVTAHLPVGDEPCYRRRLPHPEYPQWLTAMQPAIARYPVRSRWKKALTPATRGEG